MPVFKKIPRRIMSMVAKRGVMSYGVCLGGGWGLTSYRIHATAVVRNG